MLWQNIYNFRSITLAKDTTADGGADADACTFHLFVGGTHSTERHLHYGRHAYICR